MSDRWTIEQVVAIAPAPARFAAAEALAVPSRWTALGADDRAAWGRCRGSGREPYDTMVDHAHVAWRCSCPSRSQPCKHALALLAMWVHGQVPAGGAAGRRGRVGRRPRPARRAVRRCRRRRRPTTRPTRPSRRRPSRPSTARPPATSASPACATGSSSSTAGSTTASAPACPTRRWPATPRGTISPPARRRPGRCPGQPGAPAGRRRRRPARLARGRARRAGCAAPARTGRAAAARAPVAAGRRGGHGVRLAGAPGRRAGRRPRHRHVDRRRSQRHAGGPHRGAPHVAARRALGAVGDGPVVRRLPPVARRLAARRSPRSVADLHRYPGPSLRALVGTVHEAPAPPSARPAAGGHGRRCVRRARRACSPPNRGPTASRSRSRAAPTIERRPVGAHRRHAARWRWRRTHPGWPPSLAASAGAPVALTVEWTRRRCPCRSPSTCPTATSTSARVPTRPSWRRHDASPDLGGILDPRSGRRSSQVRDGPAQIVGGAAEHCVPTGTSWSRRRCSAPTAASRRRRPPGRSPTSSPTPSPPTRVRAAC